MTGSVVLVLVALAVALAVPPHPRFVLATRLGIRSPDGRAAGWAGVVRSARWRAGLVAPGIAVGLLVAGVGGLLLAATVTGVALGLLRLRSAAVRRREGRRTRARVVEACDALAAEMRAGQPTHAALTRVAATHPELAGAVRTSMLGADVPAALRRAASAPGAGGLGMVAAAWQVAAGSGAGLTLALERTAESLRAEEATARQVSAALAPPRATARLLAVLPVLGLALGSGLGGDPIGFLFGSLVGNGCLALGCGLALAGVGWVEGLAARAEAGAASADEAGA
ncbi:MAG: type II secretion system protein [Propionibacteriales bacterium]|nr:type II secretion system protein [Propionibacteriales bacterium]